MSTAGRWDALSHAFTARVEGTGDWDAPAPCEGWTARDVVAHLAWMPHLYLGAVGRPVPDLPTDPVAQWRAIDAVVRELLADDALLAQDTSTMAGQMTLGALIDMTGLMDLLVHTWDLARATGQDETLDADECAAFLTGIEPMDAVIRDSGQFGPRVPVPADADAQTKLIAFTGRTP
jgi:uncharacterized protein (TIGR03086 family)